MDYLLEIADRLLPSVKSASEEVSPDASPLTTANIWFKAARKCVIDERKKRDGARVPERQPPEGVLDKEVMADVLARHPESIPDLLCAVGQRDFCPPFIADVVRSAVGEAGQGSARPKKKLRAVFTRFLSREYAELLEGRPHRVASVLVESASWKDLNAPVQPARTPRKLEVLRNLKDNPQVPRHIRRRLQQWAEPEKPLPADAVRQFLESDAEKEEFVAALRRELLKNPRLLQRLAEAAGVAVPFSLAFALELDEIALAREKRGRAERNICTDEDGSRPLNSRTAAPSDNAHACRFPSRLAEERGLLGLAFSGGGHPQRQLQSGRNSRSGTIWSVEGSGLPLDRFWWRLYQQLACGVDQAGRRCHEGRKPTAVRATAIAQRRRRASRSVSP